MIYRNLLTTSVTLDYIPCFKTYSFGDGVNYPVRTVDEDYDSLLGQRQRWAEEGDCDPNSGNVPYYNCRLSSDPTFLLFPTFWVLSYFSYLFFQIPIFLFWLAT